MNPERAGGLYKDQGVTQDVRIFQSPTVLIASSSTSADVSTRSRRPSSKAGEFGNVTSAMKGVTAAHMAEAFGMKYHPGAEKYSRSGIAEEVGSERCARSPATRASSSAG